MLLYLEKLASGASKSAPVRRRRFIRKRIKAFLFVHICIYDLVRCAIHLRFEKPWARFARSFFAFACSPKAMAMAWKVMKLMPNLLKQECWYLICSSRSRRPFLFWWCGCICIYNDNDKLLTLYSVTNPQKIYVEQVFLFRLLICNWFWQTKA